MSSSDSSSSKKGWSERLGDQLDDFFGIDLRTLGIVRMVAAITILWTLWILFKDVSHFFSGDGVYPPRHWVDRRGNPFTVSIHMVRGEIWWQYFLFGAQAVFGLMLLVGYKTKFAGIMTWLLLISLFQRTPPIMHRGDTLLCLLLLWGLLTPWGARLSVDAALNKVKDLPKRVTSFATAGLILQMPVLYFVSVILKFEDSSWLPDMTAVAYSLSPEYVTPIGEFLVAHQPFVATQAFTAFTLLAEGVAPILMFLPLLIFTSRERRKRWLSRLRLIGIGALSLMQFGLLLTVAVGLFPLISTLGLLAALPSSVWDRWGTSKRVQRARKLVLYYDPDCGFCRKMVFLLREFLLPRGAEIAPADSDPEILELMEEHNSWVIRDADGELHFRYEGFLTLIENSPWAFIALRPLAVATPLGDKIYGLVANNRPAMGRLTRGLQWRAYHIKPTLLSSTIAVVLLVNLFVANADSVHNSRMGSWKTPSEIRQFQRGIRIHQNWRMFVRPFTWSSYYVLKGRLKDGTEIDLFQGGPIDPENPQELTWDPPEKLQSYEIYENYRWRLYFQSIRSGSHDERHFYAAYVCRSWNQHYRGDQQLDRVWFYRMVRTRELLKEPMAEDAERRLLWRHWCFGRPDDDDD